MRILDIGCGSGEINFTTWGVAESDEVQGVDIDEGALVIARQRFPKRTYMLGRGENLPFGDARFDRVISSVAMNYMNVPKTLSEIHRVLISEGRISLSLLPVSFTMVELRRAFPRLIPSVFRLYVLRNGLWFHCTGKTVRFVTNRTESFHTERGMRIALRRAGFTGTRFSWREGMMSKVLVVEAKKGFRPDHAST
jgi:ubiquinone/menaquinone biosynthesis C-methylase UbiE